MASKLDQKAVELDKNLQELVMAIANPANTSIRDELLYQIERLKTDIALAKSEARNARDIDKDLLEFARFAFNYLAELKDNWWQLEHEERLWCEKMLFPSGIFIETGGKISHPEISAVFSLTEPNSTKKNLDFDPDSLLVELRGIAPRSVRLLASALQA